MKASLLASILLFAFVAQAQDYEPPKKYKLKKAEDFSNYENDFIGGYNWLMSTPLGEQAKKRTEINKFMLEWLTGSPSVTIEIKGEIVTFMSINPDLLMIFMAGWGQYSLSTGDKDKVKCTLSGLDSVIEFYQKNENTLKKDPNVEKYIQMKEEGTLEEYVKKNA